jgi:hypothetical protein
MRRGGAMSAGGKKLCGALSFCGSPESFDAISILVGEVSEPGRDVRSRLTSTVKGLIGRRMRFSRDESRFNSLLPAA